jgi:hypothetical protein
MTFQQDKTFPYCGRYLVNWMNAQILQQRYQRVWKAFVDHIEDAAWATEALTFGKGPLVRIVTIAGTANGQHTPGVEEVKIDPLVANEYEVGRNPRFQEPGWLVWESTVLHELVHWGRHKAKKSRTLNGKEAGEEFEIQAYGKNIHCGCKVTP